MPCSCPTQGASGVGRCESRSRPFGSQRDPSRPGRRSGDRWRLCVSTGDLLVAARIRRHERVIVVAPSRKSEPAGRKSVHGVGNGAAASDRGRVAACEQADPSTVDEGLVGLVGAGDLSADDRGAAVVVVDGQQYSRSGPAPSGKARRGARSPRRKSSSSGRAARVVLVTPSDSHWSGPRADVSCRVPPRRQWSKTGSLFAMLKG